MSEKLLTALAIGLVVFMAVGTLFYRHKHLQHMPNCYAIHGDC